MVQKPWQTHPSSPSSRQADNGDAQTGAAATSTKYCNLFSKDNALFADRCNYEYAIAQPCRPGTLTDIDTTLRNFFNTLRGIQEYGDLYVNGVLGESQKLTYEISRTISIVSGVLRTFTQRLRTFILGLVQELIQGAIQCLLTPLLEQIKDTVFGLVLDQLMCKFDEIMNNLKNLVSDFLFALINIGINNPAFCAIEAFTNALLNKLANDIDEAIAPILDQIGDLLGGAAQVVGSVFSVIDQVLAYEGLLCAKPKCPKDVTKFKTGPLGGPSPGQKEGFAKMIGSPSKGLGNFNDEAEEWLNETFPANSNIPGASDCYTGPYECGTPQVVLFGGGGSGGAASAVVNAVGQIIGFNLLNPGQGYNNAPFVSVVDPGGCGGNVQAYAVMTPDGDQIQSVNLTPNDNNGGFTGSTGSSPYINYFIGAPNPVQLGNTVTLSWDVSNYTSLSLSTDDSVISGFGNIGSGTTQASFVIGEDDVQFPAGSNVTTKSYTLSATNTNGATEAQPQTSTFTFSVNKTTSGSVGVGTSSVQSSPPSINSFTGSPSVGNSLLPGSILTLSWDTSNANQVTLSPNTSTATLPVDGSLSVTIPNNITSIATTSYTLTATNTKASSDQQSASQTITYTVNPASVGVGTTTATTVGVGTTSATTGIGTTGGNSISEIGDVNVLEGGIDYDDNDEVSISGGNNGAVLTLTTTSLGQVVAVNVVNPGSGFTSVPVIEINSKNGVGAKLSAQLKFNILTEDEIQSIDPTKLVKVIDCVYK